MKTATYMANRYEFRNEFIEDYIDSCNGGLCTDVQPIDAPDTLSAGYSYQIDSLCGNYAYDIPAVILRS